MSSKLFIEISSLRHFSGCVNRDDLNQIKTQMFGNRRRIRYSQQSRGYARQLYKHENEGTPKSTKARAEGITTQLRKNLAGTKPDEEVEKVSEILVKLINSKKNLAKNVIHISPKGFENFRDIAIEYWEVLKKVAEKELVFQEKEKEEEKKEKEEAKKAREEAKKAGKG